MKFTVLERLTVLQLLPRKGNLTTLRIVRDLERELSFSEEEHAALQFRKEGDVTAWQAGQVLDKEIEFGPVAIGLVKDALAEMDKAGTLQISLLDLCEKVGYEGPDDECSA